MLVDVHAHIDSKELLPHVETIVQKCKELGFVAVINNGTDPKSNRTTIALSKTYSIIKPALGLFPTTAEQLKPQEIKKELLFIENAKPFAIGEVGLDFFRGTEKEKQIDAFKNIIALAKKIDKPLIIHSRNAEKEVIEMLVQHEAPKVILHCFSGKKNLIHEAIKKNFYFSVPPNIVRSEHFQNLVRIVPTSLLLTETDAPYLGPKKEEVNYPMNVTLSLQEIAKLKNLDEREIAKIVYMNFQRLFL